MKATAAQRTPCTTAKAGVGERPTLSVTEWLRLVPRVQGHTEDSKPNSKGASVPEGPANSCSNFSLPLLLLLEFCLHVGFFWLKWNPRPLRKKFQGGSLTLVNAKLNPRGEEPLFFRLP